MDPLLVLTLLAFCLLFAGGVVGRPPDGSSEQTKARYREIQKAYGRLDGRHDLPDGTRPPSGTKKKSGQDGSVAVLGVSGSEDQDGDGVTDLVDNCPNVPNPIQSDTDGDGPGDGCDNCPLEPNPEQGDGDLDGVGDLCDGDGDNDGLPNGEDPCPFDAADDADGDGICGEIDNCPQVSNASQQDTDGDGVGDACDNCPNLVTPDRTDTDGDGAGDVCDLDDDADAAPDGPGNIFLDNFESGANGWFATGLWHLAASSLCPAPDAGYTSASTSWYYGQDGSCDYATGNQSNSGTLTSPDISGVTFSTRLQFDLWREVENFGDSAGADLFTVEASDDNFSGNIQTLLSLDGTDSGFSWTPLTFSLAGFAGETVRIRFSFDTDDGDQNSFVGVFVDSLSVANADNCRTTPNPDQQDGDGDLVGDVCDNCPAIFNPEQQDEDGDGDGNLCDPVTTGRLFAVEGDTDTIYELNPITGVILNSFAPPEDASGASDGLAYDPEEDALYFTNGFGSRQIWKLDADTGATLAVLPPPTADRIDGLGFHEGFLYAEAFESEMVLRIDPSTGVLLATFSTDPPRNLGGGMDADLYVIQQLSTILHLNPDNGFILTSYPSPDLTAIFGVGFDGGNLWIQDDDSDTLFKLDARSGTLLGNFVDPTPGNSISGLAAGPGDGDGDGRFDDRDNCSSVPNPNQEDDDGDGQGDACDLCPHDAGNDSDGDGVCDDEDLCAGVADPGQPDGDGDGVGDACDPCPGDPLNDQDADGVCGNFDLCPSTADPQQRDSDGDGQGDACDICPYSSDHADGDGDGVVNCQDNCPGNVNPGQEDLDGDGVGQACDDCIDTDGDGHGDPGFPSNLCPTDNCPAASGAVYVDATSGDDANSCLQPDRACRSIQRGAEVLVGRHEMVVGPGIYYEAPVFDDLGSSIQAPVWIRAEPRGSVTISGMWKEAALGQVAWDDAADGVVGDGIYSAPHDAALFAAYQGTYLFRFQTLDDLRNAQAGNTVVVPFGIYADDVLIYVRLPGDIDPNGRSIQLSMPTFSDQNGFDLVRVLGSPYVIFDGFKIEGNGKHCLFFDRNSDSPTIRNTVFSYCRYGARLPDQSLVEWSEYVWPGFRDFSEAVRQLNGGEIRTFELVKNYHNILLLSGGLAEAYNSYSSINNEFRYNFLHESFDGELLGEFEFSESHHNVYLYNYDNHVQMESTSGHDSEELKLHHNLFLASARVPISHQEFDLAGPQYVYRNVVYGLDEHGWSAWGLIKSDVSSSALPIYYYHNLLWGRDAELFWDEKRRDMFRFRNNIFIFRENRNEELPGEFLDTNFNILINDVDQSWLRGAQGIYLGPDPLVIGFLHPSTLDFGIAPGSPAENQGVNLGWFNMGAPGGPDIGPFEVGENSGPDWPRPRETVFVETVPERWVAPPIDQTDTDGDGVGDLCDVCVNLPNPGQEDSDGDGTGDLCDTETCDGRDNDGDAVVDEGFPDGDGDGVADCIDVCPLVSDSGQEDRDQDGLGDACDGCPDDPDNDTDLDGVCGDIDNCPKIPNGSQVDQDGDTQGDACDLCPADPFYESHDEDGDGLGDICDNCVGTPNPGQEDQDGDGSGDACDDCPLVGGSDLDLDGVCADVDNCPNISNPTQSDGDLDGEGDPCDACTDRDGDGFGDPNVSFNTCPQDNCPDVASPDQTDSDGDGLGDPCDPCPLDIVNDSDGDGACDSVDNCAGLPNPDQIDMDGDGLGDLCDPERDGDGIDDTLDNCPSVSNPTQNDADSDGWGDDCDNCPTLANSDQEDGDGDGLGDVCDACTDDDGDLICSSVDNCPDRPNHSQTDSDMDGVGDLCDPCPGGPNDDDDGDGICNHLDDCLVFPNPNQVDSDGDGKGDACDGCPQDPDDDGDADGLCLGSDNCPAAYNPNQLDEDGDGVGDLCDACPGDPINDPDGDGICATSDNCPLVSNGSQSDGDSDGTGDECDPCPNDLDDDVEGDGACADVDNCPAIYNFAQLDSDLDGQGDLCDVCPQDPNNDSEGDGVCADVDNCPGVANPNQEDADADGIGDACDVCPNGVADDLDADGVCDAVDNCLSQPNPNQGDSDGDGAGDVCDPCPGDPNDDQDGDGICGDLDNCPVEANADQLDTDADGVGNACDDCPQDPLNDLDGDLVCGDLDNCPNDSNDQSDADGDGRGDACDACPNDVGNDDDGDGLCASSDNCPLLYNILQVDGDGDGIGDGCDNCPQDPVAAQLDTDGDGQGDACDIDDDGDGATDAWDRCPLIADPLQQDTDGDGQGDACDEDDDGDGHLDNADPCPLDAADDVDGDGRCSDVDNCPGQSNADQTDSDGDGEGDECDTDDDNDVVPDSSDTCPLIADPLQLDADLDGMGDACDPCTDTDGDGFGNPTVTVSMCSVDNCPNAYNPAQTDGDGDKIGDACDVCPSDPQNDTDGDGFCGESDNCPHVSNPSQADENDDGVGDACDLCSPGVDCLQNSECDDGNPCTDDTCSPLGACIHLDNVLPCNDGVSCTISDNCSGGVCLGQDSCTGGDVCNLGTGICGDPPPPGPSVNSFTLIDADADIPILAYDPMVDGAIINLATLPTTNLNIRANTSGSPLGSVVFDLDGSFSIRVENAPPYALNGDQNGDYSPWNPGLGLHSLAATPHDLSNGSGTSGNALAISFTVVNQVALAGELGGGSVGYDFGLAQMGSTVSQVITLQNRGTGGDPDITVSDAKVAGGVFVENFSGPVILAPGASTSFIATFGPATTGSASAPLIVSHDGNNAPLQIQLTGVGFNLGDQDMDGICDSPDNCPSVANSNQADLDGDGIGDACDLCTDTDQDGLGNPGFSANTCAVDNCPNQANPGQGDSDGDGIGDACDNEVCDGVDNDGDGLSDEDLDTDVDGAGDCFDNCLNTPNPGQEDQDGDGLGNACDPCTDSDGDGWGDPNVPFGSCPSDNCPMIYSAGQLDGDGDGLGDVCDPCPGTILNDTDEDGVCGDLDNCPGRHNPGQIDTDGDGSGDICDVCPSDSSNDADADGVCGGADNCPAVANPDQTDTDSDGAGNACDLDDDEDGLLDPWDNCPLVGNPDQTNTDGDGAGDACDTDDDGDGIADGWDNCPLVPNPALNDLDGDGVGDACDPDIDNDGVANLLDCAPVMKGVAAIPGAVGPSLAMVEDGVGTHLSWSRGAQGHTSCVHRGSIVPGMPWSYDLMPLGAQVPRTDTSETAVPPLGEAFYYLVSATNVCGGSQVGLDSQNQSIPFNSSCDVPVADYDADGVPDPADNCPLVANAGLSDADGDFVGDSCDNCPLVHNPDQNDTDSDGIGDACAP